MPPAIAMNWISMRPRTGSGRGRPRSSSSCTAVAGRTGTRPVRFVAAALAARGFLTVVPDYRLFPAVRFPAFLRDNAAAVAWTKANIARFGGDPRRMVLMGHSAGAYNAVMLTLDKQWFAAEGLDPDRDIAGTAGLAGPYDFLPLHDPDTGGIFAPAGDLRLSQPITFARGDAPPLFLAAGSADPTVLPRNTEHLAEAIRRDGGRVEERILPASTIRRIIGAMAGVVRWLAPSLADVTGFLGRSHATGGGGWRPAGKSGGRGVAPRRHGRPAAARRRFAGQHGQRAFADEHVRARRMLQSAAGSIAWNSAVGQGSASAWATPPSRGGLGQRHRQDDARPVWRLPAFADRRLMQWWLRTMTPITRPAGRCSSITSPRPAAPAWFGASAPSPPPGCA